MSQLLIWEPVSLTLSFLTLTLGLPPVTIPVLPPPNSTTTTILLLGIGAMNAPQRSFVSRDVTHRHLRIANFTDTECYHNFWFRPHDLRHLMCVLRVPASINVTRPLAGEDGEGGRSPFKSLRF